MRSPLITVTALALAAVAGCTNKERVTTRKSPPVMQQRDLHTPAEEEPGEAPVATAEKPAAPSLAEKMAAYARDMESQSKQRQARKPPAAAKVTPGESEVAWADNANSSPPAMPSQSVGATPASSNQVALVTPTAPKTSDIPIIVPEGEDVPGQTGLAESTQSTDQLRQQLAAKAKENPKDLASQLDYQLMQFVRGERVPHMPSISGLSSEDREALTAVLDGLSNFRSGAKLEQNQLLSRKVRPLVEMADRLRAQTDLSLPNASLCTRVDGFGVYEPITPARFAGSKEHPFIIYCEVENFASVINDKKLWETKLSYEAVLYTETGLNVWSDKADSIVDLSRNRRHDFFVVKKSRFQANMPIGRYVLKLTVTDQQSNRVAETTVPVQFVAQ